MIEIEAIDWQVRLAVFQGRVNQFDRRVAMGPPVPDDGIDLQRGRSRGIYGYEAERERIRKGWERAVDLANAALAKVGEELRLPEFNHQKPSIRAIQAHVGAKARITVAEIISERRTADVVKPRQIAMLLSKMLTVKSLPEIGRQFGNRDHTTVLHAIRKLDGVQHYVRAWTKPEDDLSLWIDAAFEGWDVAGL